MSNLQFSRKAKYKIQPVEKISDYHYETQISVEYEADKFVEIDDYTGDNALYIHEDWLPESNEYITKLQISERNEYGYHTRTINLWSKQSKNKLSDEQKIKIINSYLNRRAISICKNRFVRENF